MPKKRGGGGPVRAKQQGLTPPAMKKKGISAKTQAKAEDYVEKRARQYKKATAKRAAKAGVKARRG